MLKNKSSENPPLRLKILLEGRVQGIGFRPMIYRLATRLRLKGSVSNTVSGVSIEVEGPRERLDDFLKRIPEEKPAGSALTHCETLHLDPVGYRSFKIVVSKMRGPKTALVMPDLALCADCLEELFNPSDRRYRYPFINCINCGPRYSIVESLPYDRRNTSMRCFKMCRACLSEYRDPADRRYHAQPNACPSCGPSLELWSASGGCLAVEDRAIIAAQKAIAAGRILALKGLGGFQLIVDAGNAGAINRLRKRKGRQQKPFAVMVGDLMMARRLCVVSEAEAAALESSAAPIVLMEKRRGGVVAAAAAPNNPFLGVMLAYTGVHHLLLRHLGAPIVATSGNLSEEPIVTDEEEALARLGKIADVFLVHNRPIVRHVDDSVIRIAAARQQMIRRARGYAPLPVRAPGVLPSVLGVGGQLKNTIAQSVGENIFVSQHIGDLENTPALEAFKRTVGSFGKLYGASPARAVCDRHPGYPSTQYAKVLKIPVESIQHHKAHILACMAENEIDGPALGVAWDGTGAGEDGAVWGGEFFAVEDDRITRVASLRRFMLVGGEQAVRQGRRVALSLLYEIFGLQALNGEHSRLAKVFEPAERAVLMGMLNTASGCVPTTSAGRLFDAAASLLGLRHENRFEAQAAMELEFLARTIKTKSSYPWNDGRTAKIKIFLSHAKSDGTTPARRIRDYIYSQTQLAAFYDENNIPLGSAFA
ncbi:MAG: carbamoyltransferase HypF, partial [Candidatus Omnitrophota bacterium]